VVLNEVDLSALFFFKMTEQSRNPFSMSYVLKATAKNMRRSINISIYKTFDRVEEFADDREKSEEVLKTLSVLHTMRKQLDDFQNQNSEKFTGE